MCIFSINDSCLDEVLTIIVIILIGIIAILLGVFIGRLLYNKCCKNSKGLDYLPVKTDENVVKRIYVDKRTINNPKYYTNDSFETKGYDLLDSIKTPTGSDDDL